MNMGGTRVKKGHMEGIYLGLGEAQPEGAVCGHDLISPIANKIGRLSELWGETRTTKLHMDSRGGSKNI